MFRLYDYPLNYGVNRTQDRETTDNDYNTYLERVNVEMHIDTVGDGTGDARPFTDIFFKTRNVGDFIYSVIGSMNVPRNVDTRFYPTIINDSGDEVDTVIDGVQNHLLDLWPDETVEKPRAQSMAFLFTPLSGRTPIIYEVMILNRLLTLDINSKFDKIEYDSIDLGTLQTDVNKDLSYIPALGGERDKWNINFSFQSTRPNADPRMQGRDTLADTLVSFIRQYKNFVCIPEYERHPDRALVSVWPNPTTQIRYLTRWKGGGRRVNFSVREA